MPSASMADGLSRLIAQVHMRSSGAKPSRKTSPCQLWTQAGPSKSQREHCKIDCPLLGDFAQHLASRAWIALAKGADVSPHAAPKTNVTDDGAVKSEPSTSMAGSTSSLNAELHVPSAAAVLPRPMYGCCLTRGPRFLYESHQPSLSSAQSGFALCLQTLPCQCRHERPALLAARFAFDHRRNI